MSEVVLQSTGKWIHFPILVTVMMVLIIYYCYYYLI